MENPLGEEIDPSQYRTKGSKAGDEMIQHRINYTAKLLSNFCGYSEIRDHVANVFEISERHAENYIADAREEMAKLSEKMLEERAKHIGQSIQRMEHLYKKAQKDGNINQMIRVQNLFNRMLGAYSQQININDNSDDDDKQVFYMPEKEED